MKVVTNSDGSGDYVIVLDNEDVILWCGHSIKPFDLVDIINRQGGQAELIEVDDEEIERYGF